MKYKQLVEMFLAESEDEDIQLAKSPHGKLRKGNRTYVFSKHHQDDHDPSKHLEGHDWMQHEGNFSEAKKKAKEWAKAKGHKILWIHTD